MSSIKKERLAFAVKARSNPNNYYNTAVTLAPDPSQSFMPATLLHPERQVNLGRGNKKSATEVTPRQKTVGLD
ncbi:MAG TPA: hypothetical protein VNO70_23215 [Blastocatellia bacterium]|nr:hypothetical protein [Blastocatellia bacterium]